jgi:hypothetical protein
VSFFRFLVRSFNPHEAPQLVRLHVLDLDSPDKAIQQALALRASNPQEAQVVS